MAEDISLRWNIEEGDAISAIARVEAALGSVAEVAEESQKTTNEAFGQTAEGVLQVEAASKRATTEVTKLGTAQKNADTFSRRFLTTLRSQVSQFTALPGPLGSLVALITSFQAGLQGSGTALTTVTRGLGLFRAALVSTGVGALVVALGSLVAFLTRTQEGINQVEVVLSQLGAGFDVIIDRAGQFGRVLTNVFSQSLGDTFRQIRATISGIGDEIAAETEQVANLTRVLQDVEQQEINLNIQRSAANAQIREQNKLLEDTTLSLQERTEAGERAAAIEQSLIRQEVENQERRVAALLGFSEVTEEVRDQIRQIGQEGVSLDQLGLSESTIQDAEEFSREFQSLSDLQTRSFEVQTTLQNKLNTVRAEEIRQVREQQEAERQRLQALEDEFIGLVDRLETQVDAVQLQSLTGADRLFAERDEAIAQVETFAQEIIDKAEEAGRPIPESFQDNIDLLIENINNGLRDGLAELDATRPFDPLVRTFEETKFEEVGEQAVKGFTDRFSQSVEDSRPVFDRIKEDILIALSISEEELQSIIGGLGTIFENFQSGLTASIDAQIAEQDALISRIDQRIEDTEAALDRELALKQQGFANDFALEKESLEALQAERDQAQQVREEAEARAARQKQIQESAAQAANLITTASELTKGFTAINPIIGLVLAGAAIATLFRIFATVRQRAAEATKLYEGGLIDLESGLIPRHLPDDRYGSGIRIPGTNIHVGGGEWVVDKKNTRENLPFFRNLKFGKYQGIDIDEVLSEYQRNISQPFDHAKGMRLVSGQTFAIQLDQSESNAHLKQIISQQSRTNIYLKNQLKKSGELTVDTGNSLIIKKGSKTTRYLKQ